MNRVYCVFSSLDVDFERSVGRVLKEILGAEIDVSMFHRDYQFEGALQQEKPILVISNGVTKTRTDAESYAIYFSPRLMLRRADCHAAVISPTCFGFHLEWLFRLKLRCFKWFSRSTAVFA